MRLMKVQAVEDLRVILMNNEYELRRGISILDLMRFDICQCNVVVCYIAIESTNLS